MKKGNLRKTWFLLMIMILSSYISGCNLKEPLLAIPKQTSYEDEVRLVQISQQLYRPDLDDQTKMQLYFERGSLYDSLGFKAFAQSDFTQLLQFNAEIPDAYNYLGMYAMEEGDYDAAFMQFNTALELSPDHQFAYINRAIALYRHERYDLALDDALTFYNYEPNEPIRALWVYLIEEQLDKQKAQQNLRDRYNKIEDKSVWGSDIIAFYLDEISEDRLMINLQEGIETNLELAQRLCETYFYLAKFYQSKGNNERAEMLLKYSLANNVYNYLEHQQALFEVNQLNQ